MTYLKKRARKRRGGRFAGLFGASIFLIVGLVLGWQLVFPGWRARLFGVHTHGTVTSVSDCSSGSGGDTGGVVLHIVHPLVDIQDGVLPTVQFTDRQGNVHEVEGSTCGNFGIGEMVTLWYLPSDPTTISLQDDYGTLLPVTLVDGAFLLVALLLILWFLLRPLLLLGIGSLLARRGNAFAGSPAQMGYGPMSYGPMADGASGGNNSRIGEAVLVEGRWRVTLTNAYPSQGGERAHPMPGRFYLILLITLRNASSELLYPRQATFRLYDTAGLAYPQVRALEDSFPDLLQPGESLSLTLAYDVPGTLHQCRLSFYPSSAFLSQANWNIGV